MEETKKIAKQEINLCLKGKLVGIKHDIQIIVGIPHVDILNIFNKEKIDLVVLGLHRHIKDQPIVGKVIERVIKSSMRPVLVVKNRSESDYENILVGVDFNIHSKKSLKLSLGMFQDSTFNLLHSYYMPFTGMIGNSTASLEKEFKATCNADLDDMIGEVTKSLPKKTGKAYKINKKIVKGSILDILQEEITFSKSELLALGTHGRTGISRALSLNVTEKFLANPSCDVLAVM